MTAAQLKNYFRTQLVVPRGINQEFNVLDALVDFVAQALTSGIPAWAIGLTFQTDASGDGSYAIHPDSTGKIRFWKTKTDDNTGNEPPTNPALTENTWWIEISPSDSSAIKEWTPGIYGAGLVIVFHNHSVNGRGLYILLEPTRPYESANIETEITAGDWEIIAGGSSTTFFLGYYTSLSALTTAHPTASEGNYAYVDLGVGQDVQKYIWDSSDNAWVVGGAGVGFPVADSFFNVFNDADPTKEWEVDLSGITAGQKRTTKIPDYSGMMWKSGGQATHGSTVIILEDVNSRQIYLTSRYTGGIFSAIAINNGAAAGQSYVDIVTRTGGGISDFVWLRASADGLRVTDIRPTPKGLEYTDDYSATYGDRSLVDKGFITALKATDADAQAGTDTNKYMTPANVASNVRPGDVSGTVISFNYPYNYGRVTPETGNITGSYTNAIVGNKSKIYHNHSVAPTFPSDWVNVGMRSYVPNVLNIITAEYVRGSGDRVEYSITQIGSLTGMFATETVAGVVEKATDAEMVSRAETGGTGAFLVATPKQVYEQVLRYTFISD